MRMQARISHSGFMRLVAALVVAMLPVAAVQAQKKDASQEQLVDLSELTLDETLMLPDVPAKQAEYVKSYMKREAQALHKLGYKVETTRQGEVVIASIPADELFAPNDTVLLPSAADRLKNFLPYFRTHGKFKVILAMHSDDTGSDSYLYDLTERRILALYGYFDSHAAQTDMLQGYPMADSEPVKDTPNTSYANRRKNRRLEIFIVPGPVLIMDAKSKKL